MRAARAVTTLPKEGKSGRSGGGGGRRGDIYSLFTEEGGQPADTS